MWIQPKSWDCFFIDHSPVVHDVTFRILILGLIVFGLKAKIVVVETAFLYGKEEIFMECLSGMTDAEEEDVLALNKCFMVLCSESVHFYNEGARLCHVFYVNL